MVPQVLQTELHPRLPQSELLETARAAEMLPVGVAWGFRSREELLAAGARVLVQTPADLAELLENKQ